MYVWTNLEKNFNFFFQSFVKFHRQRWALELVFYIFEQENCCSSPVSTTELDLCREYHKLTLNVLDSPISRFLLPTPSIHKYNTLIYLIQIWESF